MGLGDGKATGEAKEINKELGYILDAVSSLGDQLVNSFQDAVDGASELGGEVDIVGKTMQRGLVAGLKESVKNSESLIQLQAKVTRGMATQKDIAKESEKLANNQALLDARRENLSGRLTKRQKTLLAQQQQQLNYQKESLDKIISQNIEYQKSKSFTQLLLENAGDLADKLDKSGTLSGILSGNILSSLTPIRLFELAVLGIFNAFKGLDETTAKVAETLGISYHEAQGMNEQFSQIAMNSNNVFVTTQAVAKSQMELSKILGTNAMFTDEMLQTQTELTHQLGLSAETSGEIAKLGLLTGKTSKEIAANVMGQSVAMNAANNSAINEKNVLQEVAKLSSSIQLSMANNPVELSKAVQTAKQFGMELSKVDGIADSLMNFEQSISNELEAELLLGKNLNLEKARTAALNNDLATVAEEIAKQAGSAAEFTAMNRIQQEALAKSVGMSKEDLAKTLQDQEILSKLGGKDKDTKAAYNRLVSEGLSQEQIAKELGDKRLASSLHAESIQDRFAASSAKIKELFVQIADAILPIVEPIADAVGLMASLISQSLKYVKVLGGITAAYKLLRVLGDANYRNQIKTNIAAKFGNKEGEKNIAQKLYSNILGKEGFFIQIKENAQLALKGIYEKSASLFKQTGLVAGIQSLAISTQESLIKMKDFIVEKASLGFQLAKNAAAFVYNGILSIGNAIKKSGLLASIAEMAMRAFSSLSAIPFIGPILGVAGVAAAAGLGYMYYNKADDMMSPGGAGGGYGSRTLMGPEGAIALNNKDTVIAGTNLFPKENESSQQSVTNTTVVKPDNGKMESLLSKLVMQNDKKQEISPVGLYEIA
ncbi:hypothetical protein N9875_00455 [bacterium]|nr:hypothetical protein [bacterium]